MEIERVNLQNVNVDLPQPMDTHRENEPIIDDDSEIEEPIVVDGPEISVRGRLIQNETALKLAKNVLIYLGLGSDDKQKK